MVGIFKTDITVELVNRVGLDSFRARLAFDNRVVARKPVKAFEVYFATHITNTLFDNVALIGEETPDKRFKKTAFDFPKVGAALV
jgi:hypothetical protein